MLDAELQGMQLGNIFTYFFSYKSLRSVESGSHFFYFRWEFCKCPVYCNSSQTLAVFFLLFSRFTGFAPSRSVVTERTQTRSLM